MYNGILEVYLDMEAHISSATQITQKEPKRNHQRKRNILNHNGPKVNLQLNTSTPSVTQRNARVNQGDHLHRMCNETGIPEFLELQFPGIPMAMMETSGACSLHDPTQQDLINACTLPIYICHT